MRNYRAFISYNHGDERIARKLHRRVEAYRPSKHLKPKPRCLSPVFRDRDEMAAATDLPDKVTTALQNSENLVVLCSPRAASSEWVNKEIATFSDMHCADRIFPVIVEGEAPGCFPPALLEATPNPLAADLQDGKDGFDDGALKLIAALLPAPFGEVKNREVARIRRRTQITGGLAGLFAILLIAAVVFGFRAVEETRRANAELTRAEAAILTLVQGIEAIVDQVAAGAESGAVSTGLAASLLATAERMAESAIAQAPDNPALNEEYGDLLIQLARHYERAGDVARSEDAATRARAIFDRLAAKGDRVLFQNVIAIEEQGDAAFAAGDLVRALGFYQVNGDLLREELLKNPDSVAALRNLAVSLDKVGDVRRARGDLPGALSVYEESSEIARDLSARDPGNAEWARDVVVLGAKLAQTNPVEAAKYWAEAVKIVEALDARGALAPLDRWMLERTRTELAAVLAK